MGLSLVPICWVFAWSNRGPFVGSKCREEGKVRKNVDGVRIK